MSRSEYPDSWTEQSIESVAKLNPESLSSGTPPDYQFKYIDISSVHLGKIDWDSVTTQTFENAPSRAKRIVRPQDVLLSTVRPTLQSHTFADWSEEEDFVCSTGFAVVRAGEDLESDFLRHLVFSRLVTAQLHRLETGSNYPAVPQDDVGKVNIPTPPLPEQRRIAEVLDAADEAIRQTERVIAKLREVKKGLLHDLLTRGLDADGNLRDPDAHPEQFKDSPLGRIPKKWKIYGLDELAYFEMGQSPSSTYVSEDEVGLPFLQGNAEFGEVHPTPQSFCSQPKKLCEPGDILISVRAPVGDLNKANQKYVIGRGLAAIRFTSMPAEFGWHLLNQRAKDLEKVAQGTTFKAISKGDLKELEVGLPPLPEQHRIAAVLDAHDARIRAEEATLDKLRQVKRGLMDDLLTGRVRVG
jgi:type I restriction enzyme S subunit